MIKLNLNNNINFYLKRAILILFIVGLGVFAINQVLEYRYNTYFLAQPCELCKDLNENQSECITGCFKINFKTYPDAFGNLKDSEGKCWSTGGKQVKCIDFGVRLPQLNLSEVINQS